MLGFISTIVILQYIFGWMIVYAESQGYTSKDDYRFTIFPGILLGLVGIALGMISEYLTDLVRGYKEIK